MKYIDSNIYTIGRKIDIDKSSYKVVSEKSVLETVVDTPILSWKGNPSGSEFRANREVFDVADYVSHLINKTLYMEYLITSLKRHIDRGEYRLKRDGRYLSNSYHTFTFDGLDVNCKKVNSYKKQIETLCLVDYEFIELWLNVYSFDVYGYEYELHIEITDNRVEFVEYILKEEFKFMSNVL
jgi:hypothetical protein